MNTGVPGLVFPFFSSDQADIVSKRCFEFGICLLSQLIAITQKQYRFRQLPGFIQPPQQVGGDNGFSGSGGQRQQYPCRFMVLPASDDFFKSGPDGGILIIAALGPGRTVGLKQHGGFRF